jgi:hypothetical protein
MPDSLQITCPEHEAALIPSHVQPGMLMCPDASCATVICILPAGFPPALTSLEQSAAANHELVLVHEGAGFSRAEAMQVLCSVITATIMKGSGSG